MPTCVHRMKVYEVREKNSLNKTGRAPLYDRNKFYLQFKDHETEVQKSRVNC